MTQIYKCTLGGMEGFTLDPLNYTCSIGELEDILDVLPPEIIKEFAKFSGPVIAQAVRDWDRQHVEQVIQLIMFSDNILQRAGLKTEDYIDISSLPSVPHPGTHRGLKIWCMDLQGFGLVGPNPNEIEIEKIGEKNEI